MPAFSHLDGDSALLITPDFALCTPDFLADAPMVKLILFLPVLDGVAPPLRGVAKPAPARGLDAARGVIANIEPYFAAALPFFFFFLSPLSFFNVA